MDASEGFTRHQILILALFLLANFLNGSTFALPAPFLPKLNEEHGLLSDMSGWMLGVYSLAHLAVIPFISRFASRLGLYEMTCWGVFLNAGSTIIFGAMEFFPTWTDGGMDWAYVILAILTRIFQGIGAGVMDIAILTMASLAFPGNTVAVQGYIQASNGIGAMSGPAIASGLFKLGGFVLVFVGVGGLELIVGIFMFILLPKNLQQGSRPNENSESLLKLLSNPRRTGALIIMMFGGMIWTSLDPILEPELRSKFGLLQEESALCFMALACAFGLTAPILSKINNDCKGVDEVLMMSIGAFLSTIAYLIAGPSPLAPQFYRPLWLLILCVGLLGVAVSFLTQTFSLIYPKDEDCNVKTNSTISGLWAMSIDTGSLLGPPLSGTIARATNFAWATTSFSGISLLFFMVSIFIYCFTNVQMKQRIAGLRDKFRQKIRESHSAQSRTDYDRI